MTNATTDEVLVDRQDQVLVITMNRPQVRNAGNGALARGLESAMQLLDADPELRVGVLTGSDGNFSSGQDLKAAMVDDLVRTEDGGWFGFFDTPPDKTLIAAVEGNAVAGGMELALACDLIVASRDARFGIPEARHSLVAVGGGLIRLPRRVPYHVAMEMAITAEPKSAEEMERHGLVNRICEPGQACATALELAALVCRNGPIGVRASQRIVRAALSLGDEEAVWAFQDEQVRSMSLGDAEDVNEGLRAFNEKRSPVFNDR